MARVLFVDDEKLVLEALENALRRRRPAWDCAFAVGGTAALAAVDCETFAVVVSDMRMPGLDGAQLLEEVRRRQPRALRVILSGYADRNAMARTLSVAHQVLGKPSEVPVLRRFVDRACRVHALLDGDAVRAALGDPADLAPPTTCWEVARSVLQPGAGAGDAANAVVRDAAIAPGVRDLLGPGTTIHQVGAQLGVAALGGLTLAAHAFAVLGGSRASARRAYRTARLAQRLATDPQQADEAFTAALVRDVGELVLARRPPAGATHAEVGALLLASWGLPLDVVEAVAYHHLPRGAGAGAGEALLAVHAAAALLPAAPGDVELDLEFLNDSGRIDDLPRWRALAAEDAGGGHDDP